MNKTNIEWCDYTWNPVVGCRRACWYCYARKIYKRFYPYENFSDIHLHPERLKDPFFVKKPSKIFVGSMTEIMDERIGTEYLDEIFNIAENLPRHTFMFLTKCTQAYSRLTDVPDNCYMGVTETGEDPPYIKMTRIAHLIKKSPGKVKFVSFEPLLRETAHLIKEGINWIIIGGLAGQYKDFKYKPNPQHVTDILAAARHLGIPVFIKDNLRWRPELLIKYRNFPD